MAWVRKGCKRSRDCRTLWANGSRPDKSQVQAFSSPTFPRTDSTRAYCGRGGGNQAGLTAGIQREERCEGVGSRAVNGRPQGCWSHRAACRLVSVWRCWCQHTAGEPGTHRAQCLIVPAGGRGSGLRVHHTGPLVFIPPREAVALLGPPAASASPCLPAAPRGHGQGSVCSTWVCRIEVLPITSGSNIFRLLADTW